MSRNGGCSRVSYGFRAKSLKSTAICCRPLVFHALIIITSISWTTALLAVSTSAQSAKPRSSHLSSLTQPASRGDQHFHHYCLPSPLILPSVHVRPFTPSQAPTFSPACDLAFYSTEKAKATSMNFCFLHVNSHPNINNKTMLISFRKYPSLQTCLGA